MTVSLDVFEASRLRNTPQVGNVLTQAVNECRRAHWAKLALLPVLSAMPFYAQAPAPSPAQPPAAAAGTAPAGQQMSRDEEPNMRTQVDEVAIDLSVRDKHRKQLLDLKPEDLVVTDNDTPVKLSGLHLVQGQSSRGHLVTILFDRFSGPMAKQARQAAQKALKVFPDTGYSFAVMDIANRLRLLQTFTTDRKLTEKAIFVATESNPMTLNSTHSLSVSITTDSAEKPRMEYSEAAEKNVIAMARTGLDTAGHNVDAVERARAQVALNALQETQKILQDQHTYRSLASLLGLVRAQGRSSERKAILYVTVNKQFDSSAKEMIKTITAAATRAGVSIYTIDLDAMAETNAYEAVSATFNAKAPYNATPQVINAHGDTAIPMQQQSSTPAAFQGSPGPNGVPTWGPQDDIKVMTDFHRQSGDYAMFAHRRSPMTDVANDSGGIYIDVQNGFKHALEQMLEDQNTYYEATYTPPFKEYDGSFRSISVRPVNKDVRVQSKSGYYALAPGAEAGLRPYEVPLLKVLDGKELPSDVHFEARVLRFGEMPDGATNSLAVEIPIKELQTKQDVNTHLYTAHASIVARIRDSHGVQIERLGEDVVNRGALESLDRDKSAAIVMARHFISAPGHYSLEVAITDQLSGKTGAQRSEFDVPEPARSATLSDMVLVRKLDGIREEDEDPIEPLRYEKNKITPNLVGELPEQAKDLSLFFILHPDASSKEDPTLEMQVIHNGKPGRRTPLPLRMASPGLPIPYLASFGSAALAPGDYKVLASLTQDGKTSQQQVTFKVAGTVPAGAVDSAATDLAAATAKNTVEADLHAPGQLAITPMSADLPKLTADAAKSILDDARDHALSYHDSLPNFICMQVTNRSLDPSGAGRWKLRDSIVEVLRYRDKNETRTTLEVNGKNQNMDRWAMKGAFSAGEFGGVLQAIFSPKSKADFQWKETNGLNSGTVQVFSYSVSRANSSFTVTGSNNRELTAGFHGQVFIDTATHSVRRLSLIADDLPKNFPTHSTRMDVDYDYVAINEHDYLVPVSAEMRLTQGKHEAILNTMEFRNYRRYGSSMKILGFNPVDNN